MARSVSVGRVAAERRSRRKRLPAEEGRRALLDAGRALLDERPAAWPLDHIRLTDVAERAGVSVGALYHYWDTQDAYRDELLDDLFSPDRYPPSPLPGRLADDGVESVPLPELIRSGAAAEFAALRGNPELRRLMSMWAAGAPEVDDRIAVQYRAVGERWAIFYGEALDAYGLELRPPFTPALMATLITALGEGLAVRSTVDPEAVPADLGNDPDRPWGLLAGAICALLPGLTRPVDGDGDGDLWDLADRFVEVAHAATAPGTGAP